VLPAEIYRITNGKIAEQWTELDLLGLLEQLAGNKW
jgi:predicted ester cyclase